MRSKQNSAALVLLVLLAAAVYGIYETGRSRAVAVVASARVSPSDSALVVDQASLTTAQELIALPTAIDERPLASEALRLGDQEMDLAFADAVRRAAMQPRAATAEARASDARLQQALKALASDEAQVAQLTDAVAKGNQVEREPLNDRLNLAKAHVTLDQDEADDARQDLMRAGGDPQARMQAMIAEHDAASRRSDSTRVAGSPPVDAGGVVRRIKALDALHQKEAQLKQARAEAESLAVVFTKRHAVLQSQIDAAGAGSGAAAPADTAAVGVSHATSAALLLATERRAAEDKARSGLDQRVDNQRHLADVYTRWIAVLGGHEREIVNRLLRGIALILLIVLAGILLDEWIEHVLATMPIDSRRLQTLYIATRVAVQVLAVVLILLVVFGVPSNLGTFLGLAGAGLTVALKDFIVSFFGWFVLMGKDGIRIGDLVEINSVTGEVVELGMFHTMLLETGSWSDSGNPTGRRVTFTNSFAIEGHYFNFSTSGQWLWDEVRIIVPAGHDPHRIVDAIQKQLDAATSGSARQAQEHWKGSRRSPHLSAASAAPSLYIKPIVGGIEITARYITNVADRSKQRTALYHTAVDLLQDGPPGDAAGPATGPIESPTAAPQAS